LFFSKIFAEFLHREEFFVKFYMALTEFLRTLLDLLNSKIESLVIGNAYV